MRKNSTLLGYHTHSSLFTKHLLFRLLKKKAVHSKLRANGAHENNEFFNCSISEAIELLRSVCGDELIDEQVYIVDAVNTQSNVFRPVKSPNQDRDLKGTNGYKLHGDTIVKESLLKGIEKFNILKASKLASGLIEYLVW